MRIATAFSALVALGVGIALYLGALPLDANALRLMALRQYEAATAPPPPAIRPPPPVVPVVVAVVRVQDVPILLSGIGTVQPYNTVAIKSHVDGELTRILFTEGQMVEAGTELATIDSRPFQAQLAQQQANRAKDQALLDGAALDLRRTENLVTRDFASRQQLDQQRASVEQYKAQLRTDDAMIDYARTQLGFTSLRSPIAGRVGIRMLDQGNFVHANDTTPIVVVAQLQPISVVFSLPAASVARARLSLGQVQIPVFAYAADDTTRLDEGKVELIDNLVDPATGTIKLKASFPNTETRLWPGDFINGRIVVDTRRDGLTIPATALRHGPRGDFVWLVGEDKTVTARGVTTGQAFGGQAFGGQAFGGQAFGGQTSGGQASGGGRVLVLTGLKRGDQVVTEGHFRLEEKTRVEITRTEPAAPRPAARTPG